MTPDERDLQPLAESLIRQTQTSGVGVCIGLTGDVSRQRMAAVARGLALAAMKLADRAVVLFDTDYSGGQHVHAFSSAGAKARFGPLQAPTDARLGQSGCWRISPTPVPDTGFSPAPPGRYVLQRLGQERLWVGRFRTETLRPGQRGVWRDDASYWSALKTRVDIAIIDCGAVGGASAPLVSARHWDHLIGIVPEATGAPGPEFEYVLDRAGAALSGVILDRSQPAGTRTEALP